MGYVAGETILDDEYNNFLSGSSAGAYGINHVFGSGTAGYGLGQTELVGTSAGTTITAAKWNSLFTAMDNVANHTNDTLSSTTARSSGDTVAIISALQADLNTLAASVTGGSVSATAIAQGGEDVSTVASAVFDTSHICETAYTFAGGDEARWFFNAGGTCRIKLTNNASNSTSKDTAVTAVAASMGNFDMAGTISARSGSGNTQTTFASTTGYYDLGTGYTTLLHLEEDAGTYANNIEVKVEAKVSAAHADSRGNNGEVITFKCSVLLNDGTRDDYTSGNLSSIHVEAEAAGTTDFAFHTVDPTTAQGLATIYGPSGVASTSNAIVNAD
jgi:hypothetical protein